MKRLLLAFAATTALAGCATTPAPVETAAVDPAPATANVAAAPAAPKPELGTFGIDTAGLNRTVAPGQDWVEFANGTYLRNLEIPADRSSFGAFNTLDDLSRTRTRGIIEEAAASTAAAGTNAQKVGDFYKSFMDEAAIEQRGAAPLAEDLQPFLAARTKADFARALGDSLDGFGPGLFPFYINQDAKQPDRYVPIFAQGGLGMPDRDYYLSSDAKLKAARD